ncbi:rubrerythrin family protein [Hippea sp. KM1]|uniref:rubrerythrin family protein n=1 Tax=Hippea sp. KM1 TaxID=944481 RepID=UPI00046CC5BA|nr:rubrerythrin family protein [Hippea sp. KM1]
MRQMTKKALLDAFAGESMAHMKYLAFSEVAEKEGYPGIAKLFKAIAYAEQVHATNHAKALGLIGTTKENLKEAAGGENFEINEMYPAYDAIAKLQGEKLAERYIHYALEAEKVHEEMYNDALKDVENNKDKEVDKVYVCPVCGYTAIGDLDFDKCPVCGVPADKFVEF